MSASYETYTVTESKTVAVTEAFHLAAKIATDLMRMQRFYGKPADRDVEDYQKEAIALLAGDYLDQIVYGFLPSHSLAWRLALKYRAREGGLLVPDDDPGKVRPGADINGCHFASFLMGNHRWMKLSLGEREQVYRQAGVSFRREEGEEPSAEWKYDKTYSADCRGIIRLSAYP